MESLADTHIHLTDRPFIDAPRDALERCRDAGVDTMLVPGFSPDAASIQETLHHRFPELPMAVGIHPLYRPDQFDLDAFLQSFSGRLNPVAIGEIGLDYRKNSPTPDQQKTLFRHQLQFAVHRNLPVIIHCVNADGDCINILTQTVQNSENGNWTRRGVLHRAGCSVEMGQRYASLGFYFSIGPDIFNDRRKKLRELARWIPDDRLLLETDAPYAKSRSGETAGPWDLPDVASALADLRQQPAADLHRMTRHNTSRLFGI